MSAGSSAFGRIVPDAPLDTIRLSPLTRPHKGKLATTMPPERAV